MLNVLEKLKLLNKNKFGIRPKKCNVESLVSFIESVRQDSEDGITETKAVFVSVKKVFFTVKHSILLDKQNNLGLRVDLHFVEISTEQKAAMCKFRKCILQFHRSRLGGTTRVSTWTTSFSCVYKRHR